MSHYPLDGFTDSTSLADFSGCEPSINGGDNTKIDISAGILKIVDSTTDPTAPAIKTVPVDAIVGLTPQGFGATFLYYGNDGTLKQEAALKQGEFLRDNVGIGIIGHDSPGAVINSVSNFTPVSPQNAGLAFADMSSSLGAINNFFEDGNRISANGVNLSINKSQGSWYFASINARNNTKSPNIIDSPPLTAANQFFFWNTTDSPFLGSAFTNVITAGIYDDGTALQADGAPVGVVNEYQWVNHRLLHITDSNDLALQYGQFVYDNPTDAAHNIRREGFDVLGILRGTTPICTIIMRGGAADLSIETDAIFMQATETGEF